METVFVTLLRRTPASFSNLNVLVAISKGMQAVKLSINKMLQLRTGDASNAG